MVGQLTWVHHWRFPQDWSLKQALDFVTQQRPQVSPNAGFMARLIRLEQSLHGTKTVTVNSPSCRHGVQANKFCTCSSLP